MTPTGTAFEWRIWPRHLLYGDDDEFVAEGFRICLTGDWLEVSRVATGTWVPDEARALAERYVETFNRFGISLALMIATH